MLFTTPTQYVALAVALVAGWLFGLASHPGGRRWKQRYAEEREAHAVARKEQELRLAEERAANATTRGEHEARLSEERARAAELERENARLGRAAPVTAATIAPRAHAAAEARPYRNRGNWFGWTNRVGTDR